MSRPVAEGDILGQFLAESSGAVRRWTPDDMPKHATGWRDARVDLKRPTPRDPDLNQPLTVAAARAMIGQLQADLDDAREAGAAQLVHTIEKIFTERGSVEVVCRVVGRDHPVPALPQGRVLQRGRARAAHGRCV